MPVISTPTVFADPAESSFRNPAGRDKVTYANEAYMFGDLNATSVGLSPGLWVRPVNPGSADVYLDGFTIGCTSGRQVFLRFIAALESSPAPNRTWRTLNQSSNSGPQWGYVGDPGLGAGFGNMGTFYVDPDNSQTIMLPYPILLNPAFFVGVTKGASTGTIYATFYTRIVT